MDSSKGQSSRQPSPDPHIGSKNCTSCHRQPTNTTLGRPPQRSQNELPHALGPSYPGCGWRDMNENAHRDNHIAPEGIRVTTITTPEGSHIATPPPSTRGENSDQEAPGGAPSLHKRPENPGPSSKSATPPRSLPSARPHCTQAGGARSEAGQGAPL